MIYFDTFLSQDLSSSTAMMFLQTAQVYDLALFFVSDNVELAEQFLDLTTMKQGMVIFTGSSFKETLASIEGVAEELVKDGNDQDKVMLGVNLDSHIIALNESHSEASMMRSILLDSLPLTLQYTAATQPIIQRLPIKVHLMCWAHIAEEACTMHLTILDLFYFL